LNLQKKSCVANAQMPLPLLCVMAAKTVLIEVSGDLRIECGDWRVSRHATSRREDE
jgi:hypothetical protein